ncbi:hypothetical protein E2C01_021997 [Portunus trituberculatus]|uniref:Uncharacterized protein n=1 Tax=Portunus trituberculatus TaxID=210409 RepID=A0A5B7E6E8_PORTR|nr:hypothetical protein [Portunus trituberculatus]
MAGCVHRSILSRSSSSSSNSGLGRGLRTLGGNLPSAVGGGGRPGVRAPVGGDGGDDDDDDDEEMSECEEGERSVAAVTAAAEEMDTETPEEARWATGGPEEGGGEGLSLRDLFPHSAL